VSSDGANFGDVTLKDKVLQMSSVSGLPSFELRLDNVAQCVLPANNTDELEISFPENDAAEKEEDCLVSITMHFPGKDEDDDADESPAQLLQKEIMNTGVIKSITGDIICEFTKEQGNFVTPRGKYSIQMLSTYMHMQGAQYSYKIKYTDITRTFLLDKPDGMRMFFVICLDKPIRQGTQKYQSLVIETNKMEHTLKINLSEAEIAKDYDGQLQQEITAPLSNNIAKIFKILAQTTVFVPKQFKSFRDEFSVRCTYKTNEGLLYPLTKSLIFVHKPTIIINYEDIASVEMQRLANNNSGTRAFDLEIVLKKKDGGGESKYLFVSIDRAEGSQIADFLATKNITVINPQPMDKKSKGAFAGMDEDGADEDDEEEDDGDYKAGQSSGSDNDSDDSGSDEEGAEEQDTEKPKPKKRPAVVKSSKSSPREKAPKKPREPKEPKEAKPKQKKPKDKNAPKKNISAYMMYAQSMRAAVKSDMGGNPSVTEVAKELGNRWKTIDSDEKEGFEEMARLDKERYAREMKEYQAKQKDAGGDAMEVGSDGEDSVAMSGGESD